MKEERMEKKSFNVIFNEPAIEIYSVLSQLSSRQDARFMKEKKQSQHHQQQTSDWLLSFQ